MQNNKKRPKKMIETQLSQTEKLMDLIKELIVRINLTNLVLQLDKQRIITLKKKSNNSKKIISKK